MHKIMNNMLEAAQPALPTVADFLTVLRGVMDPHTAAGTSAKLFGQMFKDKAVAGKPKGSARVHKSSIRLALEFEVVRNAMGEINDSLDTWFADLACFTLEPSCIPYKIPYRGKIKGKKIRSIFLVKSFFGQKKF